MWSGTGWDWLVVGVLYAVGVGTFTLLGGFASASRAVQRWGRTTSIRRARRRGMKLPPGLR